ncbi:hypothetical protein K438DRAFT_1970844 [Mycena galopus ATCC 62051]|nr:hypothetical protein K438DRAFT_1970844 [Mycena galopus ATCC 62051]
MSMLSFFRPTEYCDLAVALGQLCVRRPFLLLLPWPISPVLTASARSLNCRRAGHKWSECTQPTICVACGVKGHQRRDCPNPDLKRIEALMRRVHQVLPLRRRGKDCKQLAKCFHCGRRCALRLILYSVPSRALPCRSPPPFLASLADTYPHKVPHATAARGQGPRRCEAGGPRCTCCMITLWQEASLCGALDLPAHAICAYDTTLHNAKNVFNPGARQVPLASGQGHVAGAANCDAEMAHCACDQMAYCVAVRSSAQSHAAPGSRGAASALIRGGVVTSGARKMDESGGAPSRVCLRGSSALFATGTLLCASSARSLPRLPPQTHPSGDMEATRGTLSNLSRSCAFDFGSLSRPGIRTR